MIGVVGTTSVVAGGVIVFVAAIVLTTPALVAGIVEMSAPARDVRRDCLVRRVHVLGGSVGPVIAAPATVAV